MFNIYFSIYKLYNVFYINLYCKKNSNVGNNVKNILSYNLLLVIYFKVKFMSTNYLSFEK